MKPCHKESRSWFSLERSWRSCSIREALTVNVAGIDKAAFDKMKEAGSTDGEILEVNQVVAYFSYSNRLLNGLGVTTEGDTVGYYQKSEND